MASPSLLTTLLILSATPAFLAPSSFADNILYSGDTLNGGQFLTHGTYRFTMQTDCNLVLYSSNLPVWSSRTYNQGTGCNLRLQTNGNLEIYDSGNRIVWDSNTGRAQGHYVLILQRDRNVVIYGGSIWETGTNLPGTAGVILSGNSTKSAVVAGDEIAMVTGK